MMGCKVLLSSKITFIINIFQLKLNYYLGVLLLNSMPSLSKSYPAV